MSVRINSNLEALKAQRSLDRASDLASRTMERLASGMRINRASDDAAGLAVAMGLNKDARVLGQGVRNINDAISYLNIADGALTNLSDITIRLKELAQQASNGSYTLTQRSALDEEAYRLTLEFNRLVSSTSFNGRMVIQGSSEQLNLQAGYSTLSVGIMDGLERKLGTGTFEVRASFGGGQFTNRVTGDVNGDGNLDVLGITGVGSGSLGIMLGNGDGTFANPTSVSISGYTSASVNRVGDVNGDGKLDLYGTSSGVLQVALGNGNGTFAAANSIAFSGTGSANPRLGDVNSDGINELSVLTGDGTLTIVTASISGALSKSQQISTSSNGGAAEFGDFNGDGKKDVIAINGSTGQIQVYLGNGDATFNSSAIVSAGGGTVAYYTVGDFNGDGIDEIAAHSGASVARIFRGNAAGTLTQMQSMSISSNSPISYSDRDGDGIKDLMTGSSMLSGNRDGSFNTATSTGYLPISEVEFHDFNNDGVLDAFGTGGGFGVWTQVGSSSTTQQYIRLTNVTDARAALTSLDSTLNRINKERGLTGSYLSRLESALNTLSSSRQNYLASEARIKDTDVAFETANLVRSNILQQSAAAIMAQATQSPRLALLLLQGG